MTQITTHSMFTDKQILKVPRKDTKKATYPILKRYKTIDALFGNNYFICS